MKNIAFIVHGQTFLKSMGTLIYFANEVGICPHIIVIKERQNKPYDNIKLDTFKKLLQNTKHYKFYLIDSFDHIQDLLKKQKIEFVVGQDMQHHSKNLCNDQFKSFSIGSFFDTLHYAIDCKNKTIAKPYKIFYSSLLFKTEFERLMNDTWNSGVCGSPQLDHSLFINKEKPLTESVVFLTPTQNLISQNTQESLENFIEYCINNKIKFIMKDRQKSKWQFKNNNIENKIIKISNEEGFPYTSLSLILNTNISITSFGTSAYESQFFGKPVMNMDVINDNQLSININSIKNIFNVTHIFNNNLSKTLTNNFIDTYEQMKNITGNPKRILTMKDNSSLDILNDIVSDL